MAEPMIDVTRAEAEADAKRARLTEDVRALREQTLAEQLAETAAHLIAALARQAEQIVAERRRPTPRDVEMRAAVIAAAARGSGAAAEAAERGGGIRGGTARSASGGGAAA